MKKDRQREGKRASRRLAPDFPKGGVLDLTQICDLSGMEFKMKKDVLISIKGVYQYEGEDPDVIELFTTGEYYKDGEDYCISYDESEATGFEGARTTLKVETDRVTMERSGSASSQLIVQNGVRHQCHYDVGYGEMTIGVSGAKIKSSLTDAGGNLMFKYSLDVNSMLASENEMYIHVKESSQGGLGDKRPEPAEAPAFES